MIYHLIAFLAGFFLDQIIGDPPGFPHPIRLIGKLISFFEWKMLGDDEGKKRNFAAEKVKGVLLCFIMICITVLLTGFVLVLSYLLNPILGMIVEAVLTCYILAAKSLKVESMKVYTALKEGTIEEARWAVSMIVGRDTENLDEKAITRAAVETVAENTSDGVIAPMIYTFLGGPVLGFTYKAINTMDSMVGYQSDRYKYFGWGAAKLDDIVNYFPSRIAAIFMILAAFIGGRDFSGEDACRIFIRDRYNHKSPNSAQTESVCAGALRIRLGGDSSYFGKIVHKPYIGDPIREEEPEDIRRSCRLMYMTSYLLLPALLIVGVFLFSINR